MNFVKILLLKAGRKWGVPILPGLPYIIIIQEASVVTSYYDNQESLVKKIQVFIWYEYIVVVFYI